MEACGEVELNRSWFVVGIPYAADHETITCIVAVMRCTKGASVNKASKRGWFFTGNVTRLGGRWDRREGRGYCDSSIEASKQERCAVNCHRSSCEVVTVAVAVAVGYGTQVGLWWVVIGVAVQVLLSSGIVVRV